MHGSFTRGGTLGALVLVAALACATPLSAGTAKGDTWSTLKKDLFGVREIVEAPDMLALEAPVRAEDAAIVPVIVKVSAGASASVISLTLVVDENPSPLVGTFTYGPAAGPSERVLSTRVRVNSYSHVRAIVETSDGKLYMTAKFVKAAGGCSAPAAKDADAALANLGKIRVKTFERATDRPGLREAQLMIRHPNNSGFQTDELTGLYIPAKFVQRIEVKRGGEVVFRMEGGISISEDPNIRFTYEGQPGDVLEVRAEDTDGMVFTASTEPNA